MSLSPVDRQAADILRDETIRRRKEAQTVQLPPYEKKCQAPQYYSKYSKKPYMAKSIKNFILCFKKTFFRRFTKHKHRFSTRYIIRKFFSVHICFQRTTSLSSSTPSLKTVWLSITKMQAKHCRKNLTRFSDKSTIFTRHRNRF